MKKLALYEPPFIIDDSRPPLPKDYPKVLYSTAEERTFRIPAAEYQIKVAFYGTMLSSTVFLRIRQHLAAYPPLRAYLTASHSRACTIDPFYGVLLSSMRAQVCYTTAGRRVCLGALLCLY